MDYHVALSLQAKWKGKPRASSGRNTPSDCEDSALLTGRKLLRASLTGLVSPIFKFLHVTYRHFYSRTPVPPITRALRALLYGATVFLSFFLMLIFMTYNVRWPCHFCVRLHLLMEPPLQAYLIAAVVIGASLGHYIFGSTINVDAILADPTGGKGLACH